jgi:hypothetical protein
MENRPDGSGAVIVVAVILLLLCLGLGGGVLFFFSRQQMARAAQMERDLLAEAQAQLEVERAQAEATAAAAKGASQEKAADIEPSSVEAAVKEVLSTQQKAWNEGNIDEFMEHYWKSDDLTFSSEGKTTRGWNATLARYRERYPTPEKMGRLTFGDLEITPLGSSAALVLGKWNLERAGDPIHRRQFLPRRSQIRRPLADRP